MLLTVNSDTHPDPSWDEETCIKVIRSLACLDLRDAKGTRIGRVQEVDTETNIIKFVPTTPSGGTYGGVYVDSNGEAIEATMQIPGLQLWLCPYADGKALQEYQVDANLNPLDPSNSLPVITHVKQEA